MSEWGRVVIEPGSVVVGTHGTWKITYIVGEQPIEAGGTIRIRPYGNPLVRPAAQTYLPTEENYVTLAAPGHVEVAFVCDVWLIATITVHAGRLVAGDVLTVTYGDRSQGSPGFKVKAVAHDLHFRLSLEPGPGRPRVALPERPLLRLIPDAPAGLRIKASSIAAADEDVALLIRAVDRFGNTAPTYAEPLQVAPIQGFGMPSEVSLKGERGAYALVNCRRAGETPARRVRIAVLDRDRRLVGRSNPVEIQASKGAERIFWGDLHCHSNLEQALETPEFVYEYARDQEKLDFIAHVEHQFSFRTRWTGKQFKTWRGGLPDVSAYNEDTWEYRKGLIERYTEPGRFAPLLGLEWAHNIFGHMNVYYPDLEGANIYPHSFWDRAENPAEVVRLLEGREAIIIPHHPSAPVGTGKPPSYWATSGYDWDYYDERFMRLVEIYSKWGCSEYLGCRRPLLNQQEDGTVQHALRRGYRLGFVAASDTHASRPGSDLYQDHTYAQSGLTAVFATHLDRGSIYRALKARRCYATTGQRIILRFTLNEHVMGQEIILEAPDQLKDMFVDVATPGEIEAVEVLKNGQVFYRYNGLLTPDLGWWRDNGWEMNVRVLDRGLTAGTDYYYVRVIQRDGGMAWSSPIWVSAPQFTSRT